MLRAEATTDAETAPAPAESGTALRIATAASDGEPILSDLADDDVVGPLLTMFADVLPEMIADMTRHAAAAARPELCKVTHQLKGSGGAYGYGVLTTLCAELELRAKGGAPDDELVRRVAEVAAIAERVLRGIPTTNGP